MSNVINIDKASVKKTKPYTVILEGQIGHGNFIAELQGTNLVIQTSHPLSENQEYEAKEQLNKIFNSPPKGKFTTRYVNSIMKLYEGNIQISV